MQTPGARLAGFISKHSPTVAAEGRTALDMLRRLVPGAVELVYDNYNGLVVGFSASDRSSDAVLARADVPIDPHARRRLVIRSVSPRQRPRRPA
jgi:hypothetical protein